MTVASLEASAADRQLRDCQNEIDRLRKKALELESQHLALSQDLNKDVFDRDLRIRELEHRLAQAANEIAHLRGSIDAIYASTSWALTAPLRSLVTLPSAFISKSAQAAKSRSVSAKQLLRSQVKTTLAIARRKPTLMRVGRNVVSRFPALEAKLIAMAHDAQANSFSGAIAMTDPEPGALDAWRHLMHRG